MPERDTTPTRPSRWIEPGMIPTLARPGDVAPGQFGPIRRAPAARTISTTGIMSRAGMPSVMQKIVFDARRGRLHDRVRRAGGRDEDAGGVGAGLADRVGRPC